MWNRMKQRVVSFWFSLLLGRSNVSMRQAGMSENWARKKEKNVELLVHWITKSSFLNVLLLSLYLSFSRIVFFFFFFIFWLWPITPFTSVLELKVVILVRSCMCTNKLADNLFVGWTLYYPGLPWGGCPVMVNNEG